MKPLLYLSSFQVFAKGLHEKKVTLSSKNLTWKLSLSLLNSADVYTLSAMIREIAWVKKQKNMVIQFNLLDILHPLSHLGVPHVIDILDEGVVLLPE